MITVLLQLDKSLRRNRFRAASPPARAVLITAVAAGIIGLILMGEQWLRPDDADGLAHRVSQWSFWCATAAALVFGYTSFEVLYRDANANWIARLPVDPASLFWLKVARVYRQHLVLGIVPLSSGVSLLWAGNVDGYLIGVVNTFGVLVWGLAVAVWVHVLAGQSLLSGETLFKGLLAGNVGPPETAFLFYSPAGALTGALTIGIAVDLTLNTALDKGVWGPFYVVCAVLTVGAVVCLVRARRIFVQDHHRIAPRFADAEILPPWREGELPRVYLGQSLGRWLPASARPLWQRDLVMYRRRFRVVIPLTVIVCVALLLYGARTAEGPDAASRLALIAVALGCLILTPVFRMAGPELGARYDARGLPVRPQDERHVQWLLAASEWLPLLVAAGIAGWIAELGALTGLVVGALVVGFGGINAIAIPWALRRSPDVRLVSTAVKGGVLLVLGGLSVWARSLGY